MAQRYCAELDAFNSGELQQNGLCRETVIAPGACLVIKWKLAVLCLCELIISLTTFLTDSTQLCIVRVVGRVVVVVVLFLTVKSTV
jgi:hypothetical protein